MFRCALFDLDGTLLDPGEGIMGSVSYALKKKGYPVPGEEVLRGFIGPPLTRQFMDYCGLDEAGAREMVETYREYYRPVGMLQNARYDGVEEMLRRLSQAGILLAVASSKPEPFVRRILGHFGLSHHFAFMGGSCLDGRREEKTQVIRYVLEETGLSPGRDIAMVGDRLHDVAGARETGLVSVAAAWGYGSLEELEKAGPDRICLTPGEVADNLTA